MDVNGILNFLQGAGVTNFHVELINPLPVWTAQDAGRVVYVTGTGEFYFGGSAAWEQFGGLLSAGDGIDIAAGVVSVDADESTLTTASGEVAVATGGIGDTHLSTGAKQGVLEYKIVPGWDQVFGLSFGIGVHAIDVTVPVHAAATTPMGVIFENALGVYLGHKDYSRLPLRDATTQQELLYLGTSAIFGRMTNLVLNNPINITGVTVEFAGPNGPTGDNFLRWDATAHTLTYDGGPPVAITGSGRYMMKSGGYSSSYGCYFVITVVEGLLPLTNQQDMMIGVSPPPPGTKRLGLFTVYNDVEIPVSLSAVTSVDLLFIENFNLYTRPASAVLNGVAFGAMADPLISHNHDDRYYTKTEFGSVLAPSGASLVGVDPSAFTELTEDEVQAVLGEVDVALAGKTNKYTNPYVALTTWNVNHALGTTDVIVMVFDGTNYQVIPDNVLIVDANNVTITFSEAQTGKVVVIG